LLLNYPAVLHDRARTPLLPPHAFLGSAVREEPADEEVETWLAADSRPLVYVSFGSFLSVRGDVLARVAAALRGLDVRVAIASGSTSRTELGEVPGSWLVREFLPQVSLLRHASLAVSHGGNNSVTEAMASAVPLLLLPFSTDQFAGAAALEEAGFGAALDPNAASVDELRAAVSGLLDLPTAARTRLQQLSTALTDSPGSQRAFEAMQRLSV
jgi:zeaxanthin glucosyltransferase